MKTISLHPHQQEVLKLTADKTHVAYFLDMGLGKTFVGSEKAYSLQKPVLLVCQLSKIDDWSDHFRTYYDWPVANLRKDDPVNGWNIINYDLIWRRKIQLKDFTLMLDESSMIQNRQAKRSKAILKLNPENVILLSGTPVGGKYENLWSQCHLLGWKITCQAFDSTYINWKLQEVPGGAFVRVVDKDDPYKNVDRLKRKLREHGAVFMKTDEVISLPETNFIETQIPVSKDYKKFRKDRVLGDIVGDNSLTYLLGLRKLAGESKLNAVKDLIDSTQDRLVIFYNFNSELAAMMKMIDRPVSIVNGKTKDLGAYEEETNSVTLVQYQAGAKGLNLQKANKIIYFTLPLSSENFEQSKKRIHRIGQTRPCFYYIPLCGVENQILASLKRKDDFTTELFKEGTNDL